MATNKEMVGAIDEIGILICDMEFKGKDANKVAEIIRVLSIIRTELNSRAEEDSTGKE